MKTEALDIWLLGAASSCGLGVLSFFGAAALGCYWAPLLLVGVPVVGFLISFTASEIYWLRVERHRHG